MVYGINGSAAIQKIENKYVTIITDRKGRVQDSKQSRFSIEARTMNRLKSRPKFACTQVID